MEADARPALWRTLLYGAIVAQMLGAASFVALLLLGQRSRLTLALLYAPRWPLVVVAAAAALAVPLTRRHVRVLLPLQVALLLVLLVPVAGFRCSVPRSSTRAIRLASHNVFFGKLGREELQREIAALDADIVVLQASYGSMEAELRARYPDRHVRQDDELVLLSRFPLERTVVHPCAADRPSSCVAEYHLRTPWGPLRVINVHAWSPRHAIFSDEGTAENIAGREAQIAWAVAAARAGVGPFVLVGDTNLPALSEVGRRHLAHLTDAFDAVGCGFGYTFPARRPWMRIDRAFSDGRVRFLRARPGGRGASDHLPLLADFEIASPAGL